MKKNKEKQELEITVENFMQDLKHYRRDNVRADAERRYFTAN